jgi:hypothetical protein
MPPIWKNTPVQINSISPNDAITTPITMMETLRKTLRFGWATPRAQEDSRTATGVVAYA